MFDAAAGVGGLAVQLVYFRGFGECRASRWVVATARADRSHDPDRLPRRPDADRPRARPCRAARPRTGAGRGARLCRRRHGGADRRALRARPASSACSASRPSCSTRAPTRSPGAPSARSPGSPAAPTRASTPAPPPRSRALLRAAAAYAAGGIGRRSRSSPPADSDARQLLTAMRRGVHDDPALRPRRPRARLVAVAGLRARQPGRVAKALQGRRRRRSRSAAAGALLLRGRIDMALLLGGVGAWLLGWSGFSSRPRQRTAKTPGAVSRVRSAMIEMELDHDTGAMDGTRARRRLAGRRLDEPRRGDAAAPPRRMPRRRSRRACAC